MKNIFSRKTEPPARLVVGQREMKTQEKVLLPFQVSGTKTVRVKKLGCCDKMHGTCSASELNSLPRKTALQFTHTDAVTVFY